MAKTEKPLARREFLARVGLAAGTAYVAPSLTSLGMARASGASGASSPSPASGPSPMSRSSGPSRGSRPSRPGGRSNSNYGGSRWNGSQQAGEVPRWMRRLFGG